MQVIFVAWVCVFAGEKLVDAVSFQSSKEIHTQDNQSNDQVHFPVQMVSVDQQQVNLRPSCCTFLKMLNSAWDVEDLGGDKKISSVFLGEKKTFQ